jgi:diguanylate cyclase (GGDEF)-like protein
VQQALHRSARDGSGFALLLLDLDHFKNVNDTLGHPSVDALLVEVARRLRATVRDVDTVARLGGDEFGILAVAILDAAEAHVLADKLQAALAAPHVLRSVPVVAESSIGVAVYPADGENIEALVHHADVSMYASKKHHRDHPSVAA